MSYDLDLFFEPAIRRSRMLEYFATREHFKVENDKVVYGHEDTGVYFFMRLRSGRNALLQRSVVAVEFEINYGRPSYFGIEAEKEMAAFVAAFQPRIHDPQMRGMGDGPYSPDGFLNGWNFGNVFAVYSALSRDPDWSFASGPVFEILQFFQRGRSTFPVSAKHAWNKLRPVARLTAEKISLSFSDELPAFF